MISDRRALTASRPVIPLSCLPLWRAVYDDHLLCVRVGVGTSSLVVASAPSGCSYPRPTRDVFERVLAASHRRQRLWLASDADGLLGLVTVSPHSKGGHLENLAKAPSARGLGVRQQLVLSLLQDFGHEGTALVSLTTRIPCFFSPFVFQPCGQLADASTAMLILLPDPAVSDSLAQ